MMKLILNYGTDVFVLPRIAAENLGQADANDLKTLLLLASDPELRQNCDCGEIAKRIGCRRDKAEASLRFWNESGVIAQEGCACKEETPAEDAKRGKKLPSDEIPVYTGEELEHLLDENTGSRRKMLDECQNIAGKVFNVLETNKVIALSEYLGLENEHILMLFAYCRARGKTSVHYIERTAYNLYNEGVDSLAKLEIYIKAKEVYESEEGKLRKLFGFGERALTPGEKTYIRRWTSEFCFEHEILEKAYEITVENTRDSKVSLAYMNRILDNWHTAGYKTPAEIDAALEAYKTGRENTGSNGKGSFDTDEFYALALKRSYEEK